MVQNKMKKIKKMAKSNKPAVKAKKPASSAGKSKKTEEIKKELENMTEKIKELEMAEGSENENESILKKYLDDFHKLTKKLNETK